MQPQNSRIGGGAGQDPPGRTAPAAPRRPAGRGGGRAAVRVPSTPGHAEARGAGGRGGRRPSTALAISSSRSITSSVASAAAHGTGPPPKVLPRSPSVSESPTSGVATTAPIGRPGGEPLGEGQRVGHHAERLGGGERAAPPDAALDLVEDQHCTPARSQSSPRRREELGRTVARAGEALHRLDDHRGHRSVHRGSSAATSSNGHLARERHAGAPRRRLVLRAVGARRASPRCGRASRPRTRHDRLPAGAPAAPGAARSRSLPRRSCRRTPGASGSGHARRQPLGQLARGCGVRHRGRVEEQRRRLLGDGPDDVRDGSARSRPRRARRRRRATPRRPRRRATSRGPDTGRTGIWA